MIGQTSLGTIGTILNLDILDEKIFRTVPKFDDDAKRNFSQSTRFLYLSHRGSHTQIMNIYKVWVLMKVQTKI